jgi:hypothetical protein
VDILVATPSGDNYLAEILVATLAAAGGDPRGDNCRAEILVVTPCVEILVTTPGGDPGGM